MNRKYFQHTDDNVQFIDKWSRRRGGRTVLRDHKEYQRIKDLIVNNKMKPGQEETIDFNKKLLGYFKEKYDMLGPARNMQSAFETDFTDNDVYEIGDRRLHYDFERLQMPWGEQIKVTNYGFAVQKTRRKRAIK
jgi:Mg2+/Co2+ transporter CorC